MLVSAIRPPFRFEFRVNGEVDRLPAIVRSVSYVARNSEIYALDLDTQKARRLALYSPNSPIFMTSHTLLFGIGDRTIDDLRHTSIVAIDAGTGRVRWEMRGQLLGAGSETALINIASNDPKDVFSMHLIGVDAATGTIRWVNRFSGCRPEVPLSFFGKRVLVRWAGACEVSADPPFLMWIRLEDGAMHDTGDATEVLERRGNDLYLTGDDRHYGSYGPGNLSVYSIASGRLERRRNIAPDRPASDALAFATVAAGYAFGDALWVQLAVELGYTSDIHAGAVYRYDVHDLRARPGRVPQAFGTWLGGASRSETYFGRGSTLTALIATSGVTAQAVPFSGVVTRPTQAVVFRGNVYVREAGGNLAIFDRRSRRETHLLAAGCGRLRTIVAIRARRYAICSNIGLRNVARPSESDAFVELP